MAEIKAVEFVHDNVTLNLPEYCKDQAAWFLKHVGEMAKGISELTDDQRDNTKRNRF